MKKILLFLCFIFVSSAGLTQEANEISQKEIEIYKYDMKRIKNYLNNLTTFISVFKQETSDGEIDKGTFYLSRPGKLRWEYEPPSPILIVAKGNLLAYYDKELDQLSYISLADSLAGFLTQDKISFDEEVEILRFTKKSDQIFVTIAQEGKENEGQLTLVFSDKNIELKELIMSDAIGKTTNVTFNQPIYGKELGNEIFYFPVEKNKRR